MSVRLKDIAKDLGVSVMTVSKALRDHEDIAERTRRRIRERARELMYEPNLNARSLASKRTYLIGLVVPDMMHSFFAEIAKGVSEIFEPLGYQILISNTAENAETELRQLRLLMARGVDGLIIASAAVRASRPLLDLLNTHKAHYVLVDRVISGAKANYVGANDEEIGVMATEHLIQLGCKHIAHIRGPMVSTGKGRLRGYRSALAKHRLTVRDDYVFSAAFSDGSGYQAMQQLLQQRPRPDGVFCYNDPVAAGAIKAILEAGLNVPRDIAVIGAGNVHYSDLLRVPLSTIDQSSLNIGRSAAELLLARITWKTQSPPKRIIFPPLLVVRESTRRIG